MLFSHASVCSKVAGDAVALAAKAGFCAPTMPYKFVPQLEDLFINQGVNAAVKAYQSLCKSTLQMADHVRVPVNIRDSDANEDTAARIVSGKTVNFVHRSLMLAMFYGALIMSCINTARASGNVQHDEASTPHVQTVGETYLVCSATHLPYAPWNSHDGTCCFDAPPGIGVARV